MERPTPIFVGSAVGWRCWDMFPEGRQVSTTKGKGERTERSCTLFTVFLKRGTSHSTGFIDHCFWCDPVRPPPWQPPPVTQLLLNIHQAQFATCRGQLQTREHFRHDAHVTTVTDYLLPKNNSAFKKSKNNSSDFILLQFLEEKVHFNY